MDILSSYVPQDRRNVLAHASTLPEYVSGAALFADISGFTPLTEALERAFGPRRGAEELTIQLNRVYDALIAEVERHGGSVISFAGDAITCWFHEQGSGEQTLPTSDPHPASPVRAAVCALALQQAMQQFAAIKLLGRSIIELTLKVAVASGPARRLVVGDPDIQLLDTLAGQTIARVAAAEHLASGGETLVDSGTADLLGAVAQIAEWRADPVSGERFAVLAGLALDDPSVYIELAAPQPSLSNLEAALVRPWLLPAVYERERAGQGEFLTEFRPAMALFLRFVGLDYDADAQAGAQLDRFIREVQRILARYEASLFQVTIGDKGSYLYAAFGAPIAHEDDARRALRAAFQLHQLAQTLGDLEPLQIGITQGTMRAGAYGGTTRRTYGAMGDDVNLAARLMQRAEPGETLVSGRVQAAISADTWHDQLAAFSFEPLPPLLVKGKIEPVPVFRLIEAGQRRAIRLQEPTYVLPMVGRAAELELVTALIDRALAGQGQVVGIVAQAGMGKSRLVAEIIRAARRRGLEGYGGAGQSYGAGTPYLAWAPIWRAFFDLDPAAPLRRQLRTLSSAIEDLAPDRLDALPLLSAVLHIALPENTFTATLEPQFRQSALHALLLDCVRAAAQEARADGGGLLFVLEDAHWLDQASLELLELLVQASADLPILTLLAYRPEADLERITALQQFTGIALAELSPADAERLIHTKLLHLLPERGGAAPPAVIAKLTERAGGNPFYAEELLNYIHDRGIDPRDPAALAAIELPASLHSLILSRIDQLSIQQQIALKVASVLGRLFRFRWLHGSYPELGAPEVLKADLNRLSVLDLTPIDTPEPELTYLFRHIATQEVAYESLAYATRAALHERIATYVEQLADPAGDQYVDLLAFHYERSDNLPKKRAYLRAAGLAAARRFANAEAVDYLGRALALVPHDEFSAQFDLLAQREHLRDLQGAREEQMADIAALAALADAHGDEVQRAQVALRRANYAEVIGDYPAAIVAAHQAIAAAERAESVEHEAAGYFRWGRALFLNADYAAARAPLEQALLLARTAALPGIEANSLRNLGLIALNQGDYAQAGQYGGQALAIFQAIGDRRGKSAALANRGDAAYFQGDYSGARSAYEEVLRLRREIGDRLGESEALGNLGAIVREQGDWSGAQAFYEQALQLCRTIGDRWGYASALNGLGVVAAALGLYDRALEYQEQSLLVYREVDNQIGQGIALVNFGEAAALVGDRSRAREAYLEALRLFRTHGDRRNQSWTLANLALLSYQSGEDTAAFEHGQQALTLAQDVGARSEQARAWMALGHVQARQGQLDQAALAYEQALDARRALGEQHLVADSLAGLIEIALLRGELAQACHYAEEALEHAQASRQAGSADPLRVYLACFQALDAAHDPRAHEALAAARAWYDECTAQLGDLARRQMFEAANHALIALTDRTAVSSLHKRDDYETV